MWAFFDNHWVIAIIAIICLTSLLESVLTIINNCVRVWFVKVSKSKGGES